MKANRVGYTMAVLIVCAAVLGLLLGRCTHDDGDPADPYPQRTVLLDGHWCTVVDHPGGRLVLPSPSCPEGTR